MKINKLVKEAIAIANIFGFKHVFRRIKDYIKINLRNINDYLRFLFFRPKEKYYIKKIQGSQMKLNLRDFGIHKELFLYDIREPVATKHLISVLRKDDIVLEAGANIGYYALIEAQHCQLVYAVEPIKENVDILKKNIKLNNYNNIIVHEAAFGEKTEIAEMYKSTKSNWHSFYDNGSSNETVKIAVEKVDDFIATKKPPTFFRMDVEGYELSILKGMKKALTYLPWLFIEVHSDIMKTEETKQFFDLLASNKYIPELIVKYDRPKCSRILPNSYIDYIYKGDKGNYEMFFVKK